MTVLTTQKLSKLKIKSITLKKMWQDTNAVGKNLQIKMSKTS